MRWKFITRARSPIIIVVVELLTSVETICDGHSLLKMWRSRDMVLLPCKIG